MPPLWVNALPREPELSMEATSPALDWGLIVHVVVDTSSTCRIYAQRLRATWMGVNYLSVVRVVYSLFIVCS